MNDILLVAPVVMFFLSSGKKADEIPQWNSIIMLSGESRAVLRSGGPVERTGSCHASIADPTHRHHSSSNRCRIVRSRTGETASNHLISPAQSEPAHGPAIRIAEPQLDVEIRDDVHAGQAGSIQVDDFDHHPGQHRRGGLLCGVHGQEEEGGDIASRGGDFGGGVRVLLLHVCRRV